MELTAQGVVSTGVGGVGGTVGAVTEGSWRVRNGRAHPHSPQTVESDLFGDEAAAVHPCGGSLRGLDGHWGP